MMVLAGVLIRKRRVIALVVAALLTPGLSWAGSVRGTVSRAAGKSIKDAVVYIEKIEAQTFSPPNIGPVMDQKKLLFAPHVLPVLAGTSVRFLNSDDVQHNVFSPSKIKAFNLGTYPKGEHRTVTFDKAGVVACLCNVHAEMSGYVVVLQNPYFAVTDSAGAFEIADVPAGKFNLAVWHEKLKAKPQPVVVPNTGSIAVEFKMAR